MRCSRPIVATVLGLAMLGSAYGKSLEEETPVLVQALAKQLVAKQRVKVATLDFTDIQGRANELGRFLAEQLAVDMVMADGITVIDRANINSVMAEHQLTAEGLVKPENAKKLGQFAGVDALLIGNVAAMDNVFTLTVKAISTETAEVVAAGRMKFDVTQDSMKQFGTVLSGGATSTTGAGSAPSQVASAKDAGAIATKRIENLEIVLRAVTSSRREIRGDECSVIRCSFDFYNRDLRKTIVVAANAIRDRENHDISVYKYRGGLMDSNGTSWWIPGGMISGLSSVMALDCTIFSRNWNVTVKAGDSSGIVDYVKRGKRCDLGVMDQPAVDAIGKYWAGAFSPILPGKNIRVFVEFLSEQDENRGPTAFPQSFQFLMELLVGSITDEEAPEAAKDLRLENLVFDEIRMPSPPAKK